MHEKTVFMQEDHKDAILRSDLGNVLKTILRRHPSRDELEIWFTWVPLCTKPCKPICCEKTPMSIIHAQPSTAWSSKENVLHIWENLDTVKAVQVTVWVLLLCRFLDFGSSCTLHLTKFTEAVGALKQFSREPANPCRYQSFDKMRVDWIKHRRVEYDPQHSLRRPLVSSQVDHILNRPPPAVELISLQSCMHTTEVSIWTPR